MEQYKLTAADFADTGQWRLLLEIGLTGLTAYLENTLHPEIEPQFLCKSDWNLNKDNLRTNIEEAVYKNPRLLDDFATKIILFDPRVLFIPRQYAEEAPGAEEELYKKVYVAEDADIMTDADSDITAAWSMGPGIKSFLMRTFPGARITCNLMNLVRSLRKENQGLKIHANARENEVDLVFLENNDLISASTHEWRHPDDIAYLLLNLLDVYGYKVRDVNVELAGVSPMTEAWDFIRNNSNLRQLNPDCGNANN